MNAGHVGIVRQFGAIVGQRDPGLVAIYPWQDFEDFNVQIQAIRPEGKCADGEEQCLEAFSIETQDVFIRATLNMHVDKRNVQTLVAQVGEGYIDKVVRPRLLQIVKDETVKYQAVDIAPKREEIRQNVRTRLSQELATRYSIDVDDFLIDNLDFRPEFKQAIADKVKAQQDALTEANKVQLETNKALQAEQQGKAEANRLRETANGQADANRTISASLTPALIQFQAIQRLADKIQIALIPSGQGIIIDPTTLFGSKQQSP